jgi:hypothetical protein
MSETKQDELKLITAWETEPALTETEIGEILAAAAIADEDGLPPADENWKPTYDMNKAAANAWLVKAARASALTEEDPPGSGIYTSKVFENCRAMARIYAGRTRATVTTGG